MDCDLAAGGTLGEGLKLVQIAHGQQGLLVREYLPSTLLEVSWTRHSGLWLMELVEGGTVRLNR